VNTGTQLGGGFLPNFYVIVGDWLSRIRWILVNLIIIITIITFVSRIEMVKVKVRKVGTSAGVILPKETLNHLGVAEGDTLFLVKSPGGYEVTPYDPEFEQQMEIAQEGIKAYRDTLRELAK
jgi:putative addiction module antidote